ncbi:hypothetical protein D3C86_1611260 [compost metagenome]
MFGPVRTRMWRTWVCVMRSLACGWSAAGAARLAISRITWKPLADSTTSGTSAPGWRSTTALANSAGRRPISRKPSAPPCAASGASELALASAAKSAPPCACFSRPSALVFSSAFWASDAFSGTRIRIWATLYSVGPAGAAPPLRAAR